MIDVLYLTRNRLAFTKASYTALVENTNWTLVRRLVVYDDSSTDGTAEWIRGQLDDAPAPFSFVAHGLGSPPAVMQSYLKDYGDSDLFAKIDSDIVVPPGWLEALASVMASYPELELLGTEAGRCGLREPAGGYGYEPCTHIGGVGLMRTAAFERGPNGHRRTSLPARGYFGFTEWQHAVEPVRGWIDPDLRLFGLDRLPVEPWASLSDEYVDLEWQRRWGPYDPRGAAGYYEWWTAAQVPA